MKLTKIYHKSKSLISMPGNYWLDIASEKIFRQKIIGGLLLPMSLLVGISSLFGALINVPIEDASVLGFLFFSGFLSFLIIFLEVYLSAWLITEIAIYIKSGTDSHAIFNLVIFSHIPFFLTLSLYSLFPQLMFVNILAFYSFYLFWKGIEPVTNIRGDKKIIFMTISALIMVLIYTLLTVIFNNIYDTVLDQFINSGTMILYYAK